MFKLTHDHIHQLILIQFPDSQAWVTLTDLHPITFKDSWHDSSGPRQKLHTIPNPKIMSPISYTPITKQYFEEQTYTKYGNITFIYKECDYQHNNPPHYPIQATCCRSKFKSWLFPRSQLPTQKLTPAFIQCLSCQQFYQVHNNTPSPPP